MRYRYAGVIAINPNTDRAEVVKSATGTVHINEDWETPVVVKDVNGFDMTTLNTTVEGLFPDFYLEDQPVVGFKTSSGHRFYLRSSTPVPGPAGPVPEEVTAAAGALSFRYPDGTVVAGPMLPAPENLTDEGVAELVATEGSATRHAISAAVGGTDAPFGASDFVNSWWCVPRSIYDDLRGAFYQGGVNREGTMQVAKFDLRRHAVERVDLGTFEKDDHNVPAFLFEDDKPPLVAIVRHAVESFVRIRVGAAPHDVASLGSATEIQVLFEGPCTYAHLIRRPGTNTVALLTRSNNGWHVSVSTDWGKTWSTGRRFHGLAYCTFRQVGELVRYAVTYHPVTSVNLSVKYLEINTVTGDVTPAHSTTPIGNLWTGTEVITANSMTNVHQMFDPESARTFDVGRGGSIAAMRIDKGAPEVGGMYGVYRFKAGGDWTWEPIVHSGLPVGYYQSGYVGGMAFGGNDDSVWIARENAGTWSTERWEKTGDTWALVDTIQSRTDGQLGRPQIPWGSEGTGLFTNVEYYRYPTDTYMDYYGDQVSRFTGITEAVTPAPETPNVSVTATTPTSSDLSYTIPSATGVQYLVGGVVTPAGSYTGADGQTINVTAQALPGYTLMGTTSWTLGLVAPAAPPELVTTGSLMYVDTSQWGAGVPTATVSNFADGTTMTVESTLTAASGVAERTSMGGLHVAISQTSGEMDKKFLLKSATVRDHMAANPGHAYYIGVLAAVTRHTTITPNSGSHKMVGVFGTTSNDTIAVRPVTNNKVTVVPSNNRTAFQETATPAPLNTAFVVDGAVSQLPAIGTQTEVVSFGTGRAAGQENTGVSWVLYAAYIEDLAVSGRTYAQAHAAFLAKHPTSSVAGDTWTAPATLAP